MANSLVKCGILWNEMFWIFETIWYHSPKKGLREEELLQYYTFAHPMFIDVVSALKKIVKLHIDRLQSN